MYKAHKATEDSRTKSSWVTQRVEQQHMGDGEGAGIWGVPILWFGSIKMSSHWTGVGGEAPDTLAILGLTKGQKRALQMFLEVTWVNVTWRDATYLPTRG